MEWPYRIPYPHGALQFRFRPTLAEIIQHLLDGGTVECTRQALKGCRFRWEQGTLWMLDLKRLKRGWSTWLTKQTPRDIRQFIGDREDYGWIRVE